MEETSIVKRFKEFVAGIGFRLFLWGNETNEEGYWEEIYQQEKHWRKSNHVDL